MRLGGGRKKGNSFEVKVAKTVVSAFSCFGITAEDCYRTPSSGGHRFAKKQDPGDLVISDRLRKLFPFHVEAKCWKEVELHHLWIPEKQQKKSWKIYQWLTQAIEASVKSKLDPIVVFKGNGIPVMCLFRKDGVSIDPPTVVMRFRFNGEIWYGSTLESFLARLKKRAESVTKWRWVEKGKLA